MREKERLDFPRHSKALRPHCLQLPPKISATSEARTQYFFSLEQLELCLWCSVPTSLFFMIAQTSTALTWIAQDSSFSELSRVILGQYLDWRPPSPWSSCRSREWQTASEHLLLWNRVAIIWLNSKNGGGEHKHMDPLLIGTMAM